MGYIFRASVLLCDFFLNNTVCFPGFHSITAEESMAQETAAAEVFMLFESIHLYSLSASTFFLQK